MEGKFRQRHLLQSPQRVVLVDPEQPLPVARPLARAPVGALEQVVEKGVKRGVTGGSLKGGKMALPGADRKRCILHSTYRSLPTHKKARYNVITM